MGKYDKETKEVYNNFHQLNISSFEEYLKFNESVFSKLLLIIKEYRSRFVPKTIVIQYLEQIKTSGDYIKEINNILSSLLVETMGNELMITLLNESADIILSMINFLTKKDTKNIIDEMYSLYMKKNDSYGDAWHKRGSFGIYTELERKVFRLNSVASRKLITQDQETLEDTLKDTLNYITFFIICLQHVDPNVHCGD